MIFLGVIADMAAGLLDALGGYHWLFARRFILPFALGVVMSIITGTWWLGLTILPAMVTLSLGYFGQGNFGRALWLVLQAFTMGFGCLITHHLAWYVYLPYLAGAGLLGGLYRNWKQPVGDLVTGLWLGSMVFFVH